jgi:hypothetical protein
VKSQGLADQDVAFQIKGIEVQYDDTGQRWGNLSGAVESFDPTSRVLVIKPSAGSTLVTRNGVVLRLLHVRSYGLVRCTVSEASLAAIPAPVVGAKVSYKCRELEDSTFELAAGAGQ